MSMSSLARSTRFRNWPITAVRSLENELQKMRLKIPAAQIDRTCGDGAEESALSGALVSVGATGRGGTGSFVSSQGLILTNGHVAYDAVRQASLKGDGENDYVKNGFVSKQKEQEIRAPSYEVWITKSCVDVSEQVVAVWPTRTFQQGSR